MISLTVAQQNALVGPQVTICRCFDLLRTDGQALYLTDHDVPLTVGSKTYHPMSSVTSTAQGKGGGFQERDQEVKGFISDDLIREEDLLAGLYKDALVRVSTVNWKVPTDGPFLNETYWMRSIQLTNNVWTAQCESLSGWTKQPVGRNYTRDCTANLGDGNCKADISAMIITGQVTVLTIDGYSGKFSTSIGAVSPANLYNLNGVLTFTSGENAGLAYPVKSHNNTGDLILWLEPIKIVGPGDHFTLKPGCDKTRNACKNIYNNLLNYRGFPWLIGLDRMFLTPDAP